MIWLFYDVLNIICMLFCYITNPIVLLFCDENGELHGFFHYWQTWDDSCNPRFYVKEHAPKFLRYDYDKHYEEYWSTNDKLSKLGEKRCYARLIDARFTTKERIQRYLCRVMWLTRNCGYGFAFYVFGRKFGNENMTPAFDGSKKTRFFSDKHKSILTRPWSFKSTANICSWLRWEVYLGWKYNGDSMRQRMIATRIAVRFM